MSVVQDGYDFGPPLHHGGAEAGPDAVPVREFAWFGVGGARHLTGVAQARPLEVEACWLAPTEAALRTVLAGVRARQGRLAGDLAVARGTGAAVVYPAATFLGVRFRPPRRDPHRGWFTVGRLAWRQRFDLAELTGGA